MSATQCGRVLDISASRFFLVCATCISVGAQEKQEKYGTLYLYREVDTQDYGTQIVILNPEAVVYLDDKDPTVKLEPETCTGKVKLKTFEAIRTNPTRKRKP